MGRLSFSVFDRDYEVFDGFPRKHPDHFSGFEFEHDFIRVHPCPVKFRI
jgi:hypothetical protein